MSADAIRDALATVPAGRWAVGVSGGADSVALLVALCTFRPDVEPIVVHLDHQTRGAESDADAAFVAALARRLRADCVVERIDALEPIDERNDEARFRLARLKLFERLVNGRTAQGVLLAHHADDRAETTLLRLLRAGEPTTLGGLRRVATLGPLCVLRPLLGLRREEIERFLTSIGQPWRTDSSNASGRYARNRVRAFLAARPAMTPRLLAIAEAADHFAAWTASRAPALGQTFACDALADLPAPLARFAGRRWLFDHGARGEDLSAGVVEGLIAMAADAATPERVTFPGGVVVRRRRGQIESVKGR